MSDFPKGNALVSCGGVVQSGVKCKMENLEFILQMAN